MVGLAREQAMVIEASRDAQAKASSLTAAAVGASLGAGLGIVLAVVMGAASALRKLHFLFNFNFSRIESLVILFL